MESRVQITNVSPVAFILFVTMLICPCVFPNAEAQVIDKIFKRKKDKRSELPPVNSGVPIPVTGKVEALKGHEIDFEIEAKSKTPGAAVEFLIRDFPIAGKITKLVSKEGERNKAIVTYWADPNSAATTDAFSFAVRYRGGKYSSAMRYDIELTGGGAMTGGSAIEVTGSADFGKVPVGSEEVREIFCEKQRQHRVQSSGDFVFPLARAGA